MNKVFLIGNLTRDPELTETQSGVKICRFSIAVHRSFTGADGERKVDYFNCVAWRQLAETVARFTRKGNKVAVSGTIETRSYEDSQGIKRNAIDIVAQDVEFLTPKGSGNGGSGDDYEPAPSNYNSGYNSGNGSRAQKPKLQPFDDDSDIPF